MNTSPEFGLAAASSPSAQPSTDWSPERLGAQLLPGGGTCFRVWTTTAREVGVRAGGADHPLTPLGNGLFETVLPVGPGTRYKFVLDGQAWPDPYARFLPDGVHGEAEVVDPDAYTWQNADWRGPLGPGDTLDVRIYQLSALVGRGAPKTVTLTL